MKKTNRKLTAGIGLALGVTIFAGAALANYSTANGYDTFKTAAKGLLKNENYTMNAKLSFNLDGEEMSCAEFTELYDRDGDVKLNSFEKSTSLTTKSTDSVKRYWQDNSYIYVYEDSKDLNSQTTVYDNADEYMQRGALDSMTEVNEDDKKTADKIIRFVELAADTFVGDLKNNIVYVSGDENGAEYEMNLDSVQIPELVNAGLSAMFSAINTSNRGFDEENRDPFLALGTDPVVKNASLKFAVDNEGRFTHVLAVMSAVGNGHEGAVSVELNLSDYGTTKPERVDVNSLPNVRRYDRTKDASYESFGSETAAVSEGYHVTEDGDVLDKDNYVVGYIEIDEETGEGSVKFN